MHLLYAYTTKHILFFVCMDVREGEILRNALKVKDIQIVDAAKILGVSRGVVYSYYKSSSLSSETKSRLKSLLDIDIDEEIQQIASRVGEPEGPYTNQLESFRKTILAEVQEIEIIIQRIKMYADHL